MPRHRVIREKNHIFLDVRPADRDEVRKRGARYCENHQKWYIRKDYYNLKSLAKWIPPEHDLNALCKSLKNPPPNRRRPIITAGGHKRFL